MIKKIEISGIHTEVTDDLKKYVTKKIGKLDQYLPVHARRTAHAEVKLKERKVKKRTECTCEVILHLPKETIMTKETTVNMFAAIDVVEQKLILLINQRDENGKYTNRFEENYLNDNA